MVKSVTLYQCEIYRDFAMLIDFYGKNGNIVSSLLTAWSGGYAFSH